jgi:hypothetical protein
MVFSENRPKQMDKNNFSSPNVAPSFLVNFTLLPAGHLQLPAGLGVAGVASARGRWWDVMTSASYATLLDSLLVDLRKQLLQAHPEHRNGTKVWVGCMQYRIIIYDRN